MCIEGVVGCVEEFWFDCGELVFGLCGFGVLLVGL